MTKRHVDMSSELGPTDFDEVTSVNVAALLHDTVGKQRHLRLRLASLPLGDDLNARALHGRVTLTRLDDQILAAVDVSGHVALECQRCLEPFEEPVQVAYGESFRIAYDVRSGASLSADEPGDDVFAITANHELDLRESLRQEIIVSLPIRPTCGEACPGPPAFAHGDDDEVGDLRLASLRQLLDEE